MNEFIRVKYYAGYFFLALYAYLLRKYNSANKKKENTKTKRKVERV